MPTKENTAHKTAKTRNGPSRPIKWLDSEGLLKGRILDFGCGRGYDANWLVCEGYDPHYRPMWPTGRFDTVVCNFVLNVIEDEFERRNVLRNIDDYLAPLGRAYIAVRNDRKKLNGHTSIGTWQGLIKLDLPIVRKTSGYIIYAMRSGQSDCDMTAETHS